MNECGEVTANPCFGRQPFCNCERKATSRRSGRLWCRYADVQQGAEKWDRPLCPRPRSHAAGITYRRGQSSLSPFSAPCIGYAIGQIWESMDLLKTNL